jgi:hypothetical protein
MLSSAPRSQESVVAHKSLETDLAYRRLQQRLDRMVTGAPDSPALQAILRLLFTPEEAELAVRMPTLCSLRSRAERVGRDEATPWSPPWHSAAWLSISSTTASG